MTEQRPSKEKLHDWLRRWYALKGEPRFREAADEIERLQRHTHEPGAVNVAPIANVVVKGGDPVGWCIYAPGLPDGTHELFPVPLNPAGEMRPAHEREPPHCGSCSCPPYDAEALNNE